MKTILIKEKNTDNYIANIDKILSIFIQPSGYNRTRHIKIMRQGEDCVTIIRLDSDWYGKSVFNDIIECFNKYLCNDKLETIIITDNRIIEFIVNSTTYKYFIKRNGLILDDSNLIEDISKVVNP